MRGLKASSAPQTRDNRIVLGMILQGKSGYILKALKSVAQSSLLQEAAVAVAGAVSTLAPSSKAVRNFKAGIVQSVEKAGTTSRGNVFKVLRRLNLTPRFIKRELERTSSAEANIQDCVAKDHVSKQPSLMEASARKIRSDSLVNDKKLQRAIVGICNEFVNITHSHDHSILIYLKYY
jgi:hypothetical protein